MTAILGLLIFLFLNSFHIDHVVPQFENKPVIVHGIVTAYTPSVEECGKDDGIMANGEIAHVGAVANDVLPFGTIVEIKGERYVVKDRFGGDYGIEKFDVVHTSRASANRWGRQKIPVKIIYQPE